MHRGGWVLHTLTALTHCTRPRYGVPNPSWKRRSDACLDQRSIGVLGWSWLIQVADVPGFSLWPRRREQEERIHKMAALKKQATARTWRPSAPFFGARMEHQSLHVTALMPTLDWQTLSTLDLWPWLSIGKVTLKIATNWYNIIYINTCVRVLG